MKRRALINTLAGGLAALPARADQMAPCRAPAGPRDGFFPNVVLTTHDNEKARFYDDLVRGKVVLISFMYTTCDGRCPLYTSNLVKVQMILRNKVGRSIFMY